jgi:CrcB protein
VRRFEPGALVTIALGGALGAPARYAIAQALKVNAHSFPWATFIANVSGAFALGVFLTWVAPHHLSRLLRPLVATGFLGAFTTFSTFAIEAVLLVRNHHVPMALLYVVTTLAAGLAAAATGVALIRRTQA